MPLPTFASCRRCPFEVDLSTSPPSLIAGLESGPMTCGRCGAPMAMVRLWPALLAMSVPAFDRRLALSTTRAAA